MNGQDMKVVLYCCAVFQDGREESAEILDSVEVAVSIINEREQKKYGCQYGWRLFALGHEIPLSCELIEKQEVTTEQVLQFKVQT